MPVEYPPIPKGGHNLVICLPTTVQYKSQSAAVGALPAPQTYCEYLEKGEPLMVVHDIMYECIINFTIILIHAYNAHQLYTVW